MTLHQTMVPLEAVIDDALLGVFLKVLIIYEKTIWNNIR